MKYSVCGIDCDNCEVGQANGCKGCREVSGTVFWGHCELFDCATEKTAEHCGKCSDFPCSKLKKWAESENPERIQNLIDLNNQNL